MAITYFRLPNMRDRIVGHVCPEHPLVPPGDMAEVRTSCLPIIHPQPTLHVPSSGASPPLLHAMAALSAVPISYPLDRPSNLFPPAVTPDRVVDPETRCACHSCLRRYSNHAYETRLSEGNGPASALTRTGTAAIPLAGTPYPGSPAPPQRVRRSLVSSLLSSTVLTGPALSLSSQSASPSIRAHRTWSAPADPILVNAALSLLRDARSPSPSPHVPPVSKSKESLTTVESPNPLQAASNQAAVELQQGHRLFGDEPMSPTMLPIDPTSSLSPLVLSPPELRQPRQIVDGSTSSAALISKSPSPSPSQPASTSGSPSRSRASSCVSQAGLTDGLSQHHSSSRVESSWSALVSMGVPLSCFGASKNVGTSPADSPVVGPAAASTPSALPLLSVTSSVLTHSVYPHLHSLVSDVVRRLLSRQALLRLMDHSRLGHGALHASLVTRARDGSDLGTSRSRSISREPSSGDNDDSGSVRDSDIVVHCPWPLAARYAAVTLHARQEQADTAAVSTSRWFMAHNPSLFQWREVLGGWKEAPVALSQLHALSGASSSSLSFLDSFKECLPGAAHRVFTIR